MRNLTNHSNLPVDELYYVGTLRAVVGVVDARPWSGGGSFNFEEFEQMRKFLMVAAVVAVAACGKKQADTSAESMGAAAGAAVDTAAHVADSAMGAMADSAHAAMAPAPAATADTGKTVVQKAADAVSAPADPTSTKMEAKPAAPATH